MGNKNKDKKKKNEYLLPAVGMLIAFAALVVMVVLVAIITDHARVNAVSSTSEVSIEKENVLSKELDQRMTEVRAALGCADTLFGMHEDRFDAFQGVTDYYSFLTCKYLYYKDSAGNLYDSDGRALTNEVNPNVKSVIDAGQTAISEPYYDGESGSWMITVGQADQDNEHIVFACGVYAVSDIYAGNDYISDYSADTYIVSGSGSFIMSMKSDCDLEQADKNIVKDLLRSDGFDKDFDEYKSEASAESGLHSVLYGDKNIYIISGISLNSSVDWYTVTVLSNEIVNSKADELRSNTLYACGVLFACIIAVMAVLSLYMKKNKQKREFAESYDVVANCASQVTFEFEAQRIVSENPNMNFAYIYLDIFNQKYLVQLFGFAVESQVVAAFSDAIKKTIKRNEFYGRLSNGSMIILATYKERNELVEKIKQINEKMLNFEPIAKSRYRVRVTGGIYCIDKARYDLSTSDMIDKAAFAQQSVKEGDKNFYAYYDRKNQDSLIQVAEVEALMNTALEGKEFKLYLQPKYNIKHNRIDGAEALVRWERPGTGTLYPDIFIPIFEKNGFIGKIDRFMLEETCKLIARMTHEGQRALRVSVNVSRVTAEDDDFLDFYINMKNKYKVADGFIELEFTESMALESYDFLSQNIEVLRKNGFATSIDDFGQGYSSFKALKTLHFDVMKLDKFFLMPGGDTERDEKLLTGVIELAHSLGMRTIMEGVETQEMLSFLRHIDCDAIQGYIYAKPMSVDDFKEFVQQAYEKKVKRGPLGESLGIESEIL